MRYCNKCGDPVSENEKFCNKCGNPLVENNNQNNNNINNNVNNTNNSSFNKTPITRKTLTHDQQNIIIGLFAGLAILGSIIMCSFAYKTLNGNVFISDTPRETGDTSTGTEVVDNTSQKRSRYQTVIISDNVYNGVSITSKEDGYKLINSDSVNQKSNCPKEILEIENAFINKYGITAVNLCEIGVDFSNEIMSVFDRVYKEFPQLKNYLTNLTLTNDPGNSGFIAAFQPFFLFADNNGNYPVIAKTSVLLNAKYFLNEESLSNSMTASSKAGHFPPNATRSSSVAHELGHYISFITMMLSHSYDSVYYTDSEDKYNSLYNVLIDFSKGTYSLDIITTAYNNYKNDTNDNIEFDTWRGTISKYALAKDNKGEYIYDETIAESFHDIFLNGDNAKVASKYVYKELKSRFERLVK